MDAVTRISYYFPTRALTCFWICSNLIINDVNGCSVSQRQIVLALLILSSFIVVIAAFTDTYTATTGAKHWVLLVPYFGPVCFALPTEQDKDCVWNSYFLKIQDYLHSFVTMLAFLLVSLFCNPVCMCIFPSGLSDGTARFDPAVVRTLPIVTAIVLALVMVCLGPPRQIVGYSNTPETATAPKGLGTENPMYALAYAPAALKQENSFASNDISLELGLGEEDLQRDASQSKSFAKADKSQGSFKPTPPSAARVPTGAFYAITSKGAPTTVPLTSAPTQAPLRDVDQTYLTGSDRSQTHTQMGGTTSTDRSSGRQGTNRVASGSGLGQGAPTGSIMRQGGAQGADQGSRNSGGNAPRADVRSNWHGEA